MSLASRRWGLADRQETILPDGLRFVKAELTPILCLAQHWLAVWDQLRRARSGAFGLGKDPPSEGYNSSSVLPSSCRSGSTKGGR